MSNSAADSTVEHGRRGFGQQQPRVQLSESDIGVLAECRSESFYYRSLPLAILAGISTNQLIRMGYLTSGRYGQVPKLGFAMFIGYLAGKLSYVEECKKKFMRLEDSEIGEMLRKGKNVNPGTFGGISGSIGMVTEDSEVDDSLNKIHLRSRDDPHVNLDIDTSQLPSMDDKMDRPESLYQFDNELNQSQLSKPKVSTSYKELRERNREPNSRGRMQDNFDSNQPARSERGGLKSSSKDKSFEDTGFSKSVKSKVNTYGDSWDE